MRPATQLRARRHSLLVVLAAVALLAACGSGPRVSAPPIAEGQTPVGGGALTVTYPTVVSSLDPILGGSGGDHVSLYPLYDRLINFDDELRPVPGLAAEWSSPDPLTFELELRPGLVFSDGTPLDADAVKANLDRSRTLPRSTVKGDLREVADVAVLSPTRVRLSLTRPNTGLAGILADRAGMMVSPAAIEQNGDAATKPVGAGAFVLDSYAPGDELRMTRNPRYWQEGKPFLDALAIKYITDGQTATNALIDKQVDVALNLTSQAMVGLSGQPGLGSVTTPSLQWDGCNLNMARSPFNNEKVRQALAYAMNPEGMNKALYFGQGEVGDQLFPSGYWAHQDGLEPAYRYDPEKAKQLIRESGLDNISVRGIIHDAPNQGRKAQIVQAQLKAVGIDMSIDTFQVGTVVSEMFEKGNYDIYCSGFSGRPDPSGTYNAVIASNAFFNAGKFAPPGVDELIVSGQTDLDVADRAAAYRPLAAAIQEHVLHLPLIFLPVNVAYQDYVGGYRPSMYKPDVTSLWTTKRPAPE